jgi:hypothetical protein
LPDFPAFPKRALGNAKPAQGWFGRQEERISPAKWAFFSACSAKTLENKGFHESKHALEQIPPKLKDFGDKDLLRHFDLAPILIGEVIPLRRDAR